MVIVSRSNPTVKELAALKDKKGRRKSGTFLVEGEKMVKEAVACGMRIVRLIVREDYSGETYSLPTAVLGKDAMCAVCDEKTPQALAAEVEIPVKRPQKPERPCLFLDGVSDPGNVGAIVRTANAAGFTELYLADCTDPFSPKSVRSSMSGIFHVGIAQGTREELLSCLEGVPLLAADMEGENLFNFTPPPVYALCVGNEGRGLSPEVRKRAFRTVRIPMEERTESLNAAVSASIAMYLLKRTYFQTK